MASRAFGRALGLAAVLGAVVFAWAAPDRGAADFYVQRGEKALRDRAWDVALEQFEKALVAEESHIAARCGLAEALMALGRRPEAVLAWRRAKADAAKINPLPTRWQEALARARKRLEAVDAASAELDAILDRYVDCLVGIADRWSTKDPELAKRALSEAIGVRPSHERARTMLDALGGVGGGWRALFDGEGLAAWVGADPSWWGVADRELVGETDHHVREIRTEAMFAGDFDVRAEAKVEKMTSGLMAVLLLTEWTETGHSSAFGLVGRQVVCRDERGPAPTDWTELYAADPTQLDPPVDMADWIVFGAEFRGERVRLLLNGHEVGSVPRSSTAAGSIGLRVQGAKVRVRRIDIARR